MNRLIKNAMTFATLAEPDPTAPPLPLVGRGWGWGALAKDRTR